MPRPSPAEPSSAAQTRAYRIDAHFRRGLVWFRRDLRHIDHAALHYALRHCREVFCAFVFDRGILDPLLARGLRADRRVEFIRAAVEALRSALREAGGELIVLHDHAHHAIPSLAQQLGVEAVFANHDEEPAALARDAAVRDALARQPCAWFDFKDQVIFERAEVLNGQGKPYGVFTPYKNAWLAAVSPFDLRAYPIEPHLHALARPPQGLAPATPSLEAMGFVRSNLSAIALPTGMSGAEALLDDFATRMDDYHARRDYPAVRGPSYLSTHLRFGTVSIRTLAARAHSAMLHGSRGAATWLSELIWRDFYFMILHHRPDLAEGASFRPEFDRIRWVGGETGDVRFAAWRDARTGYPLVDAAMLQIRQSGYMHNRLRMVTASFLIKDLGVDWRRGEHHFADALNDFDFAANNGGWQWAASSGCDAQPWFRIFNPVTQSEKFDPQGHFIRKYLPQLAKLPDRYLHAPWTAPADVLKAAGVALGATYPRPIVEHAAARAATLARYAPAKVERTSGARAAALHRED
ncbi:cryptochrome/photolyase family protein [Ralstonia solanacearum]|uniref:cryptochrome/photolyase family protein n=1 Tax=Ralstonia solanacearum TaxID=305 RepID=UPI0005AC939E|nr:deoxyribodipyrimidine photo-lyase [Ralstonia solanacearum]